MTAVDTLRVALYGNPPSDSHKPDRSGVIAAITELQAGVDAAVNGAVAYATVADLPAVTAENNGDRARVYADPTDTNNTYWIVKGGVWVIDSDYIASVATVVQPLVDESAENVDLAHAWADGTEPGGSGTKSSKEWSDSIPSVMQPFVDETQGIANTVAATIDTSHRGYLAGKQVERATVALGYEVYTVNWPDGTYRRFITDLNPPAATTLSADGNTITAPARYYLAGRLITTAEVTSDSYLLRATFLDGKQFPPTAAPTVTTAVTIHCWGDSLTAGAGGGTPYTVRLASTTGLTVVNYGIGGQTSRQIAGRMGAVIYGLTVDSSSLSGGAANRLVSGANPVTAVSEQNLKVGSVISGTGITSGTFIVAGPDHSGQGTYQVWPSQTVSSAVDIRVMTPSGGYQYYTGSITGTTMTITAVAGWAIQPMASYPYNTNQILSTASDNTSRSVTGYLGSVHGTLARSGTGSPTTAETYTFTPDAGSTLPALCPANTPFIPDYAYDDQVHVFWLGRNNYSEPARVLADIAACVRRLKHRKFIVMSVINGNYAAEFLGGANYGTFLGLEQALANAYPANFLNIRRLLIDKGLSTLGITPTTQDTTDIANDTVPSSLRTDNVHLTNAAYQFVADQIKTFANAKGYF